MNYYGYAISWLRSICSSRPSRRLALWTTLKVAEVLKTEHFETVLGDTWFDNQLLAKECYAAR